MADICGNSCPVGTVDLKILEESQCGSLKCSDRKEEICKECETCVWVPENTEHLIEAHCAARCPLPPSDSIGGWNKVLNNTIPNPPFPEPDPSEPDPGTVPSINEPTDEPIDEPIDSSNLNTIGIVIIAIVIIGIGIGGAVVFYNKNNKNKKKIGCI